MRARQLIEQTVDELLEANTTRDQETKEPVSIQVPILPLILLAFELLLDIRDLSMVGVSSMKGVAVTAGDGKIIVPHKQ